MSMLQLLKKIIRGQSVKLTEPVTNLYGKAPVEQAGAQVTTNQTWARVTAPGAELLTRDALLAAATESSFEVLPVTDGVCISTITTGVQLLRTVVRIPVATTLALDIAVGDPVGQFAVYVNSALQRRGSGELTLYKVLPAGTHVVEIVTTSAQLAVQLPTGVLADGLGDVLNAPQWISVVSTHGQVTVGTPAVRLEWATDPMVGGYKVLRRTPQSLGLVSIVGAVDPQTNTVTVATSTVTTLDVPAGSPIFVATEQLGWVMTTWQEGTTQWYQVRVRAGTLSAASTWRFQPLTLGGWVTVHDVTYTPGTPQLTYVDLEVVQNQQYQYALQAYGVLSNVVSPLSEVKAVTAGDSTAPAAITVLPGYPIVRDRKVVLRFQTPTDTDYAGVRVYARVRTPTSGSLTVQSVAGQTVTFTGTPFTGLTLNGALCEFTTGAATGIRGRVLSNTNNALTFDFTIPVAPTGGDLAFVVKDTAVLTDYGRPGVPDELTFEASTPPQTYRFHTFDTANNEQVDTDAVSWTYEASADTFAYNGPPVVTVRQLTPAEQAAWASPFNDNARYVLVEIDASDPGQGVPKAGVTLFYQVRGQAQQSMAATTAAVALTADNPSGTRSRFVALDRSTVSGEQQSWIRVWATDAQGVQSDTFTYTADFDDEPELSSVFAFVDNVAKRVTLRFVADDDTYSVRWWLTEPRGVEPTSGVPTVLDTATTKSQSLSFELLEGERREINVQPCRNRVGQPLTPGVTLRQEYAFPPRSALAVELRDAAGRVSADTAKLQWRVLPDLVQPSGALKPEYVAQSGLTVAGAGSTSSTLTLVGTPLTAAIYTWNEFTNSFYWVEVVSGTGAGQVRRITSNATGSMTITPNWTTIPHGATVRIIRAGVRYFIGSGDETYTTGGPIFTTRQAQPVTIEWQAFVQGVPAEPVQRYIMDSDNVPVIGSLVVTVPSANNLRVTVGALDDDVKTWEVYLRKGATATTNWPTVDGNAPVRDSQTRRWNLNQDFLRYEGDATDTILNTYAGDGDWRVVVVPYNSFGDQGEYLTQLVTIGGVLSNLRVEAADNGTDINNRVIWDHNATIPNTGGTYTVDVAVALDGGSFTNIVTGRVANLDSESGPSAFTNTSDTGTLSDRGSVIHDISAPVVARGPGGTQRRYTYRVTLYNSAVQVGVPLEVTNVGTYVESVVPSITSVTATDFVSGPSGICQLTWFKTVQWQLSAQNDNEYSVTLQYSTESSPGTWLNLATGLSTAVNNSYDDNDAPYDSTGTPGTYYRTYRLQVIRNSDQVVVATQTSSTLTQNLVPCNQF